MILLESNFNIYPEISKSRQVDRLASSMLWSENSHESEMKTQ